MKTAKKLLAALLAFTVIAALSSCGESEGSSSDEASTASSSQAEEVSSQEESSAYAEESSETVTEESSSEEPASAEDESSSEEETPAVPASANIDIRAILGIGGFGARREWSKFAAAPELSMEQIDGVYLLKLHTDETYTVEWGNEVKKAMVLLFDKEALGAENISAEIVAVNNDAAREAVFYSNAQSSGSMLRPDSLSMMSASIFSAKDLDSWRESFTLLQPEQSEYTQESSVTLTGTLYCRPDLNSGIMCRLSDTQATVHTAPKEDENGLEWLFVTCTDSDGVYYEGRVVSSAVM